MSPSVRSPRHPAIRMPALPSRRMAAGKIDTSDRIFLVWGVTLRALVGQAFDDGGLERGDALFQHLVLLARLLRHGLDRLELLALHDFEIAQDSLGLNADHGFDLFAHAFGRAGRAGDELAQLVEEPACGLRHALPLSGAAGGGPPQPTMGCPM